ncbi:cytosine deaminase [Thelephora terrestris]|uniref:Cytosine deaminase n=1 Tax=Thelephora terrestris TaxID=56493 RepID=A0A9P6HQ50_9AGAM|nr:cytosine deaminase [Thelephora terrestris]
MLFPETTLTATPPTKEPLTKDLKNMEVAIQQARLGFEEGGIPIGGALASRPKTSFSADGKLLGVGRNKRIQEGSPTKHGEIDCLENIGRLSALVYKGCTMYTTLSPCTMCSGAIVLFGIRRVVLGENTTFVGGEDILISRGVEIINLDLTECKELMIKFTEAAPEVWNEDIGEE